MSRQVKKEAERLRALLAVLNIKPSQVTRDTGLAQNRLSQYMTGDRPLTIDAALSLSHAYGVSLDWLYKGDPSALPQRLSELRRVG